jgi:hypothetical protein
MSKGKDGGQRDSLTCYYKTDRNTATNFHFQPLVEVCDIGRLIWNEDDRDGLQQRRFR